MAELLNTDTTYSINHVPDFIGKAAWEPVVADRKIHLEAFGMYTDVYDRVSNATPFGGASSLLSFNTNRDTTGWGAGGGFILPVLPKLLDIQGTALVGRGIERYGSSQLTEVVANPNGSLDPLPEAQFLLGAVVHATPQLDIYAYGGGEKILSTQVFINSTAPGYGNPFTTNNSGCNVEFGTCSGATKDAWEITGGFWDKVYEGAFGSLRVGLQYAYIQRELYPGIATAALAGVTLPANFGSPKTNENTVRPAFVTIRSTLRRRPRRWLRNIDDQRLNQNQLKQAGLRARFFVVALPLPAGCNEPVTKRDFK